MSMKSGLNRIAAVMLITELTVICGIVLSLIAVIANQPVGYVSPSAA